KMVASIYFFRGLTLLFLLLFTLNVKWLAVFLAHPWLLFLFSITFGIVDFAVVAPTVKMLSEYFQGPCLGTATGFLYMSHQLGSAIGSYLPGVLFDRTGSYTSSLAIAAVLLAIACFLSACLPKPNTVLVKNDESKFPKAIS
ncbi:MAG: MFS transporter, partial [Bacillales bacterium]|nr:MFS transporter [Bacillales bacterium]